MKLQIEDDKDEHRKTGLLKQLKSIKQGVYGRKTAAKRTSNDKRTTCTDYARTFLIQGLHQMKCFTSGNYLFML